MRPCSRARSTPGKESDTVSPADYRDRLARFAALGLCPRCRSGLEAAQVRGDGLICPVCSYMVQVEAGFVVALPSAGPAAAAPRQPAAGWAAGIQADMDAKSATYLDKYQGRTRSSRGFLTRRQLALDLAGPAPGRVLEPGCGPGVVSPLLAERGVETHGVDLSAGQLCAATQRDERTLYVQGDLEKLPYRAEVFDTVVLLGVFEYVERPEKVAQELARVLKRGGRLVVSVPNSHSLPRLWTHYAYLPLSRPAKRLLGRPVPGYWRRLYSLKGLTRLLAGVGLSVQEARFFEVILAPPPFDHVLGEDQPWLADALEARVGGRLRRALSSQVIVCATAGKA